MAAAARPRRPIVRTYRAVLLGMAVVLCGALAVHLGCRNAGPPSPKSQPALAGSPVVRVRVVQDAASVSFKASAKAEAVTLGTPAAAAHRVTFPAGTPIEVTRDGDRWRVGGETFAGGDLTVRPEPPASVSVEGRFYRGEFRLVATKAASFDVVNHLAVDDYLKGVLSAELYPEFHVEAYKAQAVIARTYAIYTCRTAPDGRHYDLHADVRSQMYGGVRTETAKSVEATDATAGTVVAYGPPGEAKIFKAYYSSCCGGATQSNRDVFGETATEPFTERSVGRRCDISAGKYHSKFDWGPVVVSKDELTRRFKAWGRREGHALKAMQPVAKVEAFKKNAAGRPVAFAIEDVAGRRYVISAEQLRLAVNTEASEGSKLFSGFVEVSADAGTIRFVGHGHGHGVGMCQWCAQAQAVGGSTYQQIVLDAFKGAVLVKGY